MYLEQSEIDRSTAGHLDRILEGPRRRAFEVLYGLTGPEIAEIEAEIDRLGASIENYRAQIRAIDAFLGVTDPGGSLEKARAEGQVFEGSLAAAEQQLAELRRNAHEASYALSDSRDELERLQHRISETRAARAERIAQLDRLRLARAGAVSHHQRTVLAGDANEVFAALEYTQCPRCLQTLQASNDQAHCVVCGQPEPEPITQEALDAEKTRLEDQVLETDDLIHHATQMVDRAEREIQELEDTASHLRARIDQQAKTAVAPFVERIADLSAEVARLEERRTASAERIGRYARLQTLKDDTSELEAQQDAKVRELAEARAAREQARERVQDFSVNFSETLERFEPPWYTHSRIDLNTYLPIVDEAGFEGQSAGVKTMINDAYYLANLMTALQQPQQIHLPGFLIIDAPRKNFGSGAQDRAAGDRIYSTIDALRAAYGKDVQILVADNDLPVKWRKSFRVVTLSYEQPLIRGLSHPGRGKVETLDVVISKGRAEEGAVRGREPRGREADGG
jgi:multidrug resistance efflux pump